MSPAGSVRVLREARRRGVPGGSPVRVPESAIPAPIRRHLDRERERENYNLTSFRTKLNRPYLKVKPCSRARVAELGHARS